MQELLPELVRSVVEDGTLPAVWLTPPMWLGLLSLGFMGGFLASLALYILYRLCAFACAAVCCCRCGTGAKAAAVGAAAAEEDEEMVWVVDEAGSGSPARPAKAGTKAKRSVSFTPKRSGRKLQASDRSLSFTPGSRKLTVVYTAPEVGDAVRAVARDAALRWEAVGDRQGDVHFSPGPPLFRPPSREYVSLKRAASKTWKGETWTTPERPTVAESQRRRQEAMRLEEQARASEEKARRTVEAAMIAAGDSRRDAERARREAAEWFKSAAAASERELM